MDGEYRDSVRIHRLERQIANLEARVRELEQVAGLEPKVAEFSAAEPVRTAAVPLMPPLTPFRPVEPVSGPVADAWATTRRAYGIESAALAQTAIPGWGAPAPATGPAPSASPVVPSSDGAGLWGTTSSVPAAPRFTFDLRDLEERFAGRAMAWIGGAALVGAAVFFLSLAFSRGWIGEELRVAIGLVVGIAALVGGAVMFDRKTPLMGNVLVAVGLGITSVALFAATRGYALIAPEFGLLGAFLAAVTAAIIAIRYDAKEVAAFGLLAALAAPPVMGASPNVLTLLFVAVTLVGTTAIALFRTWLYLPPLAFVLAAPQLASYLFGGVGAVEGLIAVAGFWVVNVVASAGEEWRIRRDSLKPSSATLVLANATFALWGGSTVLTGANDAQWVGAFIGVLSVAHLGLGGWFFYRQGLNHLFGNLVAGSGIALVAIAAFVQLGAPVVPLAWAAEATALAWLAVRRTHKWSAIAALVLGGLAVAHVLLVEYPLWALRPDYVLPALPWLHAAGASALSVVAALLVTAVLVPVRWIRSALVAAGVLLAEYVSVFEVRGAILATTLVGLALAAIALERVITARGTRPSLAVIGARVRSFPFALGAAVVAGCHVLAFVVGMEFPIRAAFWNDIVIPAVPWLHPEGASAAVLVAGLTLAAVLIPVRWVRSFLLAIGVLVLDYVSVFEVRGAAFAGTLVLVALVALLLERVVTTRTTTDAMPELGTFAPRLPLTACAGVIVGAHATVFVALAEYPSRTFASHPATPYGSLETLSLVFLLGGLLAAGRLLPDRGLRSGLAAVAVLVTGWTLCTQLVDLPLYAALAVLLPLAVALERWLVTLADRPVDMPFAFPAGAGLLAPAAGAATWIAAVTLATYHYLPPLVSGQRGLPFPPFTDETAMAAVALIGAAIAAARWTLSGTTRTALLLAATAVAAGIVPLEVLADLIVPLWLILAAAALVLAARRDLVQSAAMGLALLLATCAVMLAFVVVAPVERLWVRSWLPPSLLLAWPVALGSVAAALALAARRGLLGRRAVWLSVAAAATGVYLVSVGVVDIFQRQVGGPVAHEELAKQAQVAMSVAWTVIGVVSLAWGLTRQLALGRHVGLGLLGIATLKVFVVDLASMDVAYRAVVLAGLGVLLIVAAGLYTRLRGPRTGNGGTPGARPGG